MNHGGWVMIGGLFLEGGSFMELEFSRPASVILDDLCIQI